MAKKDKKDKQTMLEKERDRLLEQMAQCQTNTDEYERLSAELGEIYKMLNEEKKQKDKVDANTKATIIANWVGIGLVAGIEFLHLLPGKAFSMIKRLF